MPNLLPNRLLNVAILGASGAVGAELLDLLEERSFPLDELRLLSSNRSAGKSCLWKDRELEFQEVNDLSFKDIDIVFASAGSSVSKRWREAIVSSKSVMIDNSSAFRMDKNVPLVVPEVNPSRVFDHEGVISNPNCTTILLTLILAPLAAKNELKRIKFGIHW